MPFQRMQLVIWEHCTGSVLTDPEMWVHLVHQVMNFNTCHSFCFSVFQRNLRLRKTYVDSMGSHLTKTVNCTQERDQVFQSMNVILKMNSLISMTSSLKGSQNLLSDSSCSYLIYLLVALKRSKLKESWYFSLNHKIQEEVYPRKVRYRSSRCDNKLFLCIW